MEKIGNKDFQLSSQETQFQRNNNTNVCWVVLFLKNAD